MMRSLCNSLMDVCFLEELRCIEVGVWLVVYMKNGVMTERKNQRPLSSITATRSAFLFPNSLEPHKPHAVLFTRIGAHSGGENETSRMCGDLLR